MKNNTLKKALLYNLCGYNYAQSEIDGTSRTFC